MGRYELDRLGFYQFEWLAQTLVKVDFGIDVEAWGGHKDHGVDAFSKRAITSASTGVAYEGPIVFQAKFVSGANGAGANASPSLLKACQAEVTAIKHRMVAGVWARPRHYFLITNVSISLNLRKKLAEILTLIVPNVVILGNEDLCSLLDIVPAVARGFPQILTYQQLAGHFEAVVHRAVNKDLAVRTESILSRARKVMEVFVPTSAYERSWGVLSKHNFVVLTGPPEMGKTSISWMIALAQLALGWQIVDCENPDDFYRGFDSDSRQVFLADDAFGKTEFDTENGKRWLRQLENIHEKLDKKHWFIWTSRRNILESAKDRLESEGSAKFPVLAEVVVAADHLSDLEKGLILYRHAVAANLGQVAKSIVKTNPKEIIKNPHFTPLRISIFVREALPQIAADFEVGKWNSRTVMRAINVAISEVTKQMLNSFRGLSKEHQWLLVSLLGENNVRSAGEIEAAFKRISPTGSSKPIHELLNDLDESFVRLR